MALDYSTYDAGLGTPATPFVTSLDSSVLTQIVYKDPTVLYLESLQKYIMILCRVRVLDLSGGLTTPGPDADTSISDIVAYLCADPSFDSSVATVTGPFWLVNSLDALPSPGFRVWLGVPSALERVHSSGQADLYVYYAMDPCDLTAGNPRANHAQPLDLGTYPGATTFRTNEDGSQGGVLQPEFRPRIGVKIIPTSALSSSAPPAESLWESPANMRMLTVPGLHHTVRIWAAVYQSPNHEVVAFSELLNNARAVDPSVVVFPTSTTSPNIRSIAINNPSPITMLFAANYAGGRLLPLRGLGIWRASMVPALVTTLFQRSVFNGGRAFVTPVFGVDFVVRHAYWDGNFGHYRIAPVDNIAPVRDWDEFKVDPEVARLNSGSYRVMMGEGDLLNIHSTPGALYLTYTDGSITDMFVPRPWA